MNETLHIALREKIQRADDLIKQMATLKEFIASCNADIGFLNITMNYRQQNEVKLVNIFEARTLYDVYKTALKETAQEQLTALEAQYKALE